MQDIDTLISSTMDEIFKDLLTEEVGNRAHIDPELIVKTALERPSIIEEMEEIASEAISRGMTVTQVNSLPENDPLRKKWESVEKFLK